MTGVTRLRRATAGDVDRLVDIARAAWLSAFQETAPAELIRYWRANDREPAWYARYWSDMTVAVAGDLVVGLVQPAADEVNGLWVMPDWHGRGVGTALLARAEDEIRAAGHSRAWLTCSRSNPRAIGFYESWAYRRTSTRIETLGDGIADELFIFEKQL